MKSKIWLAMLALYIIWGSTYLGIRLVVETIPPFLSAAIRFTISALIIITWRKLAGDPWPTLRQWRNAVIVGLFLLTGANGLISFAEQTIPSGVAALVIASTSLWLTLFEALRPGGVKPGWQASLGLLVGFFGIYLLVGPGLTSEALHLDLLGTTAIISAPILWSLGSIYSKSADMPQSTLLWTGMQMAGGAAGLFLISTLTGELPKFSLAAVSLNSWLGLLYLVSFGSLVGFVAYAWLLRNAPLPLVATYAYVNPVVAIFLGVWLAEEMITGRIILAALVILGAVLVINLSKQAKIIQEGEVITPAAE